MSLVILYSWYLEGSVRVLNVVYIITPLQTRLRSTSERQVRQVIYYLFPGIHRNDRDRMESIDQDLCGFIVLSDQTYMRLFYQVVPLNWTLPRGQMSPLTFCYWVQNRYSSNLKSSVKAPHLNLVTGHTLPGKDTFQCFPAPSTEGRQTSSHLLKPCEKAGHNQLPALPWARPSGTNTPCSQMRSGSWLLGTCIETSRRTSWGKRQGPSTSDPTGFQREAAVTDWGALFVTLDTCFIKSLRTLTQMPFGDPFPWNSSAARWHNPWITLLLLSKISHNRI